MDPILQLICLPLYCFFKNAAFYQRPKLLERCGDKFANELEITSLLNKLRDTHGMLSGLQNKE